jgi:hypothetical protein
MIYTPPPAKCPHTHTGSCSPGGVYLYVRCMDCGELLCLSPEGEKRITACPGYTPSRTKDSQDCVHCWFDYWDHVEWGISLKGVEK